MSLSSGFQTTVLRLSACSVFAVVIAASLSGCGRNEPPAATFAKAEGQLLVRAKSITVERCASRLALGGKGRPAARQSNCSRALCIRVKLPANYKFPLHSHSNAMDVTVVSGTLYVANAQSLDKKKAFAIKPGDFYHLPALAPQLSFTTVETVLEIHGEGPYAMKYANAADDPLKGAPPPAYFFPAGFETNELTSTDSDATVDMTY